MSVTKEDVVAATASAPNEKERGFDRLTDSVRGAVGIEFEIDLREELPTYCTEQDLKILDQRCSRGLVAIPSGIR